MKKQLLALSLLAATNFAPLGPFSPAQAANTFTFSEREKNNTDSTAQVLPEIFFRPTPASAEYVVKGQIASASFGGGSDVDVYRVDIGAFNHRFLDRLTVDVNGFTANLYYDANNNGRAETSELVVSVKGSQPARTLASVPRGTYFIGVVGTSLIAPTPYTLTLQVALKDGVQKEVEPNNTPEQGTVVDGFVVGGREVRGSINITGDGRDYYRFKLGTAQTFDIHLLGTRKGDFCNLYHDRNRDGRTSASEFLVHQPDEFNFGGLGLQRFLEAGEYILEVVKPFSLEFPSTNYSLLLGEFPN